MTDTAVHLLKVPLRADMLAVVARRRRISLRDLDEGYLVHCLLRELWQERAPSPFVVRGHRRRLDVWGYGSAAATSLLEHARAFGDPELLSVVDGLDEVSSKPMPRFETGTLIGFHLRTCPVVRLARGRNGHRAGAEVDAFLARSFQVGPDVVLSREQVYRDWLAAKVEGSATGVRLERVAVAAFSRERFTRRTHGAEREGRHLERPDVRFEGELSITDGGKFLGLLAGGVGRHRAFGFGALMVVPPGSPYPRC